MYFGFTFIKIYISQLRPKIGPFLHVKIGENFKFQAYFMKVVRNIHVYPKTGENIKNWREIIISILKNVRYKCF